MKYSFKRQIASIALCAIFASCSPAQAVVSVSVRPNRPYWALEDRSNGRGNLVAHPHKAFSQPAGSSHSYAADSGYISFLPHVKSEYSDTYPKFQRTGSGPYEITARYNPQYAGASNSLIMLPLIPFAPTAYSRKGAQTIGSIAQDTSGTSAGSRNAPASPADVYNSDPTVNDVNKPFHRLSTSNGGYPNSTPNYRDHRNGSGYLNDDGTHFINTAPWDNESGNTGTNTGNSGSAATPAWPASDNYEDEIKVFWTMPDHLHEALGVNHTTTRNVLSHNNTSMNSIHDYFTATNTPANNGYWSDSTPLTYGIDYLMGIRQTSNYHYDWSRYHPTSGVDSYFYHSVVGGTDYITWTTYWRSWRTWNTPELSDTTIYLGQENDINTPAAIIYPQTDHVTSTGLTSINSPVEAINGPTGTMTLDLNEDGVSTHAPANGTQPTMTVKMDARNLHLRENSADTSLSGPGYAANMATMEFTFWPGITGFQVRSTAKQFYTRSDYIYKKDSIPTSLQSKFDDGYDIYIFLPVTGGELTLFADLGEIAWPYNILPKATDLKRQPLTVGDPDLCISTPIETQGPYFHGYNCVSSDLSWAAVRRGVVMVSPQSVAPVHIPFGYSGTKRQNFTFNEPLVSDKVDIDVTLHKGATGNGTVEDVIKRVLVQFTEPEEFLKVEPLTSPDAALGVITFMKGVQKTVKAKVSPIKSGATMVNVSVASGTGTINGINATVSGDEIVFSGKPTKIGLATFQIIATVDGTSRTLYYDVYVEDNPDMDSLELSQSDLNVKYNEQVSEYINVTTNPAGAVLGTVTVEPTSWNGLTITVDGNRILVSGVPTANGTKEFAVKSTVNMDAAETLFVITATGAPEEPSKPTEVVSGSSSSWQAEFDTTDGTFTMSTPLAAGVSADDISSIVATFKPSDAVTDVVTTVVDGKVVVTGKVADGHKPEEVVLDGITATLSDGTEISQTGLGLGLTAVINQNKPAVDDKDDDGSSSCDAGFAGLALLALAPVFLRKKED